jgi:hypothetical protein
MRLIRLSNTILFSLILATGCVVNNDVNKPVATRLSARQIVKYPISGSRLRYHQSSTQIVPQIAPLIVSQKLVTKPIITVSTYPRARLFSAEDAIAKPEDLEAIQPSVEQTSILPVTLESPAELTQLTFDQPSESERTPKSIASQIITSRVEIKNNALDLPQANYLENVYNNRKDLFKMGSIENVVRTDTSKYYNISLALLLVIVVSFGGCLYLNALSKSKKFGAAQPKFY